MECGGACTQYEEIKHREYGNKVRPGQLLLPFVVDTFGAYGKACAPFLGRLAKAYAGRFGAREGRTLLFCRLNLAVIRAVATLACASG